MTLVEAFAPREGGFESERSTLDVEASTIQNAILFLRMSCTRQRGGIETIDKLRNFAVRRQRSWANVAKPQNVETIVPSGTDGLSRDYQRRANRAHLPL